MVLASMNGVHVDTPENARRFVACWNACEHIPTEALEKFESIKAAGLASMESVRAESAELAAMLLRLSRNLREHVNSAGASVVNCKACMEELAKVDALLAAREKS